MVKNNYHFGYHDESSDKQTKTMKQKHVAALFG